MIFISHQGSNGGNRDYCGHFSETFETAGKFLIVFIRLVLGKVGVDVYTGPRRKSGIRYEFKLKSLFNDFGCKQRFSDPLLMKCLSNN